MNFSSGRTSEYKPGLSRFCAVPLIFGTCLLYAGGFTTSIEAGMAFLDWPLSNGSINPDGWLVDPAMRAEHSHRLLGAAVGLLSIVMLVWIWLKEARRWLRILAALNLVSVIAQGLVGGLRVRLDHLNTGIANEETTFALLITHSLGAQIVICIMIAIAVANSRAWIEATDRWKQTVGPAVRLWGLAATGTILAQIFIGAIMRHADAGLAIPTFPHAQPKGGFIPVDWNWAVAINFSHRIGAVLTVIVVLAFVAQIWAQPGARRPLGLLAVVPTALLALQVCLGAIATWTLLNAHAATLHLLIGAFLLASCWMLTFLSFRIPTPDNNRSMPSVSDNTAKT